MRGLREMFNINYFLCRCSLVAPKHGQSTLPQPRLQLWQKRSLTVKSYHVQAILSDYMQAMFRG